MICNFVIALLWFAFGMLYQNASAYPVNLPHLKNKRQMSSENSEETEVRKPHTKSSTELVGTSKKSEDDFEEISLVHVPEHPKQLYSRRFPLATRHGIHIVSSQHLKKKHPQILEEGEKFLRDKLLNLEFISREESDHSLFGRFVAASLKNITDRGLNIELQHDILQAIIRTQIRMLKKETDLKNMSVLHAVETTTLPSSPSKRQSYSVEYENTAKEIKSEDNYRISTEGYNDNHNFALYSK